MHALVYLNNASQDISKHNILYFSQSCVQKETKKTSKILVTGHEISKKYNLTYCAEEMEMILLYNRDVFLQTLKP